MNCRTKRAYNMPMRCAGARNVLCLIAVLLLGAAGAAPAHAETSAPTLSSIRVTGDARVTAKPDRVQIDIGVSTHAPHSQDAAAANAREVDAVLAAVRKAAGPAAVLKTINYSLSPTYQYHQNGGEPTLTGYNALNVVQVTLDELPKIGAVIDSATQSGANQIQGIQFTLRDAESVRAEALREAAVKARAEAEVLATALGLKVVRILSVEETSPRVVPVRTYAGAARITAAAVTPTPVEAGTLDVSADVVLTVEVSPGAH
jgi:hypothetical protein